MEQTESLLKSALAEIEKLLSSKTVVGEPMEINGNTIIPLSSIGFGFGAGGGTGKGELSEKVSGQGEGVGAGTGGGGGIKPVAVIIVSKDGQVTVEPIRSYKYSLFESLGEAAKKFTEKTADTKKTKE